MADETPPPKKKKKLLKKTEVADAATEGQEASGGGGGKKGLIIMVAVGLLMMGVGVGVGIGVSGMLSGGDEAAAESANSDESADADEADEEEGEEDGDAGGEDRHSIYVSVGKLLATVESNGATRYIQAEVDLVGYDKDVTDEAMHEMPAIRNKLLLLFSSQKFDDVRTVEGREALRAASVEAVNEVLGLTKKKNKIEDAYFTAFVLQ